MLLKIIASFEILDDYCATYGTQLQLPDERQVIVVSSKYFYIKMKQPDK